MKNQPEMVISSFTGELRCGANNGACGKDGIWHILWRTDGGTGFTSLACDKHMEGYRNNYEFIDHHYSNIDCDMPGNRWAKTHCTV